MGDTFPLLIGAVFANNFVLTQFLGVCPLFGVGGRLDNAWALGLATAFVMTLSAIASQLIDRFLLVPFDLEYLRLVAFVVVIAALVQFTDMVIRASDPLLHQVLGIYLPLITTNCAVLGVALLAAKQHLSLFATIVYAFGAAAGFTLVVAMFAALRARLDESKVPAPFRGVPIALISAGLMSLAFMGFRGIGG
jgi:electron transport complex protein RnfA